MADVRYPFVLTRGRVSISAETLDRLGFEREPERRTRLAFYDTFDSRLYRSDVVLGVESADDGPVAFIRNRLSWKVKARQLLSGVPRFWWQMSPGPVRDELRRIAGVRALLPVVGVEVGQKPWVRVDHEGKVRVRAVVERWRADGGGAVPSILRLYPVKGYKKQARRAHRELMAAGLVPDDYDVVAHCAEQAGAQLGRYDPSPGVPLDPRSPAGEATRIVLGHFLDIIEANRDGVCSAIDSEFLHDFRVATRRTRSLLRGTRGVLPKHVVSQFSGEFRWLSGITSQPRDLDVYLLDLPDYADRLSGPQRSALDPLRELLESRRTREYGRLEQLLGSHRYARLVEGWRRYLLDGRSRERPPRSDVAVVAFASGVIWKAHKRLLRHGRQISVESPPQLLHDLRKDSKKLRYLIEAFSSLYPRSQVAKSVRRLRKLQGVLGGHHDIFVHMVALRELAADLARNGAARETVEAIGHLANALSSEGAGRRGRFDAAFAEYDSAENRSAARSLFRGRRAK